MDTRSVDPQEVAYYERLASTWWDRTGPFWPLHRLNELRIRYIEDQVRQHGAAGEASAPLAGLAVLDIGCGGGILSESIARLGATVHGIDVVEKNLRVARDHAAASRLPIRYEMTTAETLATTGVVYDVVLNMEVVEHVSDVGSFMSAACQLTRPGGLMFVATLNRTLLSFVSAIVGAEYVLRWLPRGTHDWRRFQPPHEVERRLSAGGLRVVDRTGVFVNPLTRQFSLSGTMAVNYMLVAHKPAR